MTSFVIEWTSVRFYALIGAGRRTTRTRVDMLNVGAAILCMRRTGVRRTHTGGRLVAGKIVSAGFELYGKE